RHHRISPPAPASQVEAPAPGELGPTRPAPIRRLLSWSAPSPPGSSADELPKPPPRWPRAASLTRHWRGPSACPPAARRATSPLRQRYWGCRAALDPEKPASPTPPDHALCPALLR